MLGLGIDLGIGPSRRGGGGAPAVPFSSIDASGWSVQYAATPPSTSPLYGFTATRPGFDSSCNATSYSVPMTAAYRVRQAYPNQASLTALTVALNDYLYSSDTVPGVTNNSAETSPKAVGAWVMADRLMVANSVFWELIAFHRDFRNNRQVAAVRVRANDGTTQTAWQVVSAPAVSTYSEDLNSIETYSGTLDVSALATGIFWLEAEVYPWIGLAASVLKSEDNFTALAGRREFTRVYFVKNVTRASAPPLAYVNFTTGNDTTGVWSSIDATARATPFASLKGALDAANDAVRGILAGNGYVLGALDGARIRISDNLTTMVSPAVTRTQNLAQLIIERDPNVSRVNAVLGMAVAMNFKMTSGLATEAGTEPAVMFSDLTINRSANVAFTGTAGNKPVNTFMNVAFSCSAAGAIIGNAHTRFLGFVVTGATNPTLGVLTGLEHRLMRGLSIDLANGSALEGWVTIGSNITRVNGVTYSDPTKGAIHYSNKYLNPVSTTAPISIDTGTVTNNTITGFVVVQNLIEALHTTSSTPGLRTSSDTPVLGNTVHVIHAHNTITGYGSIARCNIFYDNTAATGRTHKLMRDVGNIYVQLNTKGDVFSNDGTKLGQFAYHHGVGCEGNISQFAVNSATPFSELQAYPGANSAIGTDPNTAQFSNAAIWTNYQGTTGTGGVATAGAGGGTYTLAGSSPAKSRINAKGLGRDLAGAARPTGATADASGAYA